MTARTPLPPTLAAGAFTTAELHAAGLPWRRTLAADLARICRGVHTAGIPDPCAPDGAAALVRLTGGVVSHVSAALWHGLPLPPRLARPTGLHLTFDRSARTHRTDLGGVVSHRVRLPSDHVLELPDGQRVTTAARTWFDLAGMLRPHEVDWLIAAGDHLVRPPWTPTGRADPVATVPELSEALARCRGRPGVRLARAALAEVRVGADSPPETFLRLALIRAGLPEPELQVAVDPADPASPVVDLGYLAARLALQYDGAGHRTAQQQARDARRDAYCLERGWTTLRCAWEDQRAGFGRIVGLVRHQLAHTR